MQAGLAVTHEEAAAVALTRRLTVETRAAITKNGALDGAWTELVDLDARAHLAGDGAERAALEAAQEEIGERIYRETGHRPLPMSQMVCAAGWSFVVRRDTPEAARWARALAFAAHDDALARLGIHRGDTVWVLPRAGAADDAPIAAGDAVLVRRPNGGYALGVCGPLEDGGEVMTVTRDESVPDAPGGVLPVTYTRAAFELVGPVVVVEHHGYSVYGLPCCVVHGEPWAPRYLAAGWAPQPARPAGD